MKYMSETRVLLMRPALNNQPQFFATNEANWEFKSAPRMEIQVCVEDGNCNGSHGLVDEGAVGRASTSA